MAKINLSKARTDLDKVVQQQVDGQSVRSKYVRRLVDKNPDVKQIDTPRHTITVDDYAFRARLKKEINRSISA